MNTVRARAIEQAEVLVWTDSLINPRIAALAPKTLSDLEAAALPLTAITAWELLFERLKIAQGSASSGQSLLIIGAAGGVGSILTQLARQLTGLTVIGTASRPETADWVKQLGAHHVLDHSQPLLPQLQQLGIQQVNQTVTIVPTVNKGAAAVAVAYTYATSTASVRCPSRA